MKKKFGFALAAALSLALALSFFPSCGKGGPTAKAGDFAGTYRLSELTVTNEKGETVDAISAYSVDEFVVLGTEGTGFLTHEETGTDFSCRVVRLEYLPSSEGENLFYGVRLTDGKRVDFNLFRRNRDVLEADVLPLSAGEEKAVSAHAVYQRISDWTDTGAISETLGKEVIFAPYERFLVDGIYGVSVFYPEDESETASPYAYLVYEVNSAEQTVTKYYAYKSDVVRQNGGYGLPEAAKQVSEPIPFSFSVLGENEFVLTIGTDVYSVLYERGKVSISGETETFYETDYRTPEALAENLFTEYVSTLS